MRFNEVRNEVLPKKVRRAKVRRRRIGFFIALLLLVAGVVAAIALPRNPAQAAKRYRATKEIVRDQATGQLRKPTAAETEAMVAQLSVLTNRSTEGLTVQPAAQGGQKVDLQGRFGGVVLGRAKADGGTEVQCVFTMAEAVEFLGLEEE
jgi:hypothetical protein